MRTAPGGHKRWSQNMFERANAARRATKPPTPAADEGYERMAAVVALKEFRAAARAEGRSLTAALDEAAEVTSYTFDTQTHLRQSKASTTIKVD